MLITIVFRCCPRWYKIISGLGLPHLSSEMKFSKVFAKHLMYKSVKTKCVGQTFRS